MKKTCLELADMLREYLQNATKDFPSGFYDSMDYTRPGNNLTHPITWGLLVNFVLKEMNVHAGIDVHLNTGTGEKIQPDVVAYESITNLNHLLFIDYESPNSSDSRPINKDINPYLAWSEEKKANVPYIVITTLPDKEVKDWSKWDCTGKEDFQKLKQNPYQYWYPWYIRKLQKLQDRTKNIAMINLNGKNVKREFPA